MTAPGGEQPQTWFFTFGAGQEHDGRYVTIPGTYGAARLEMIRRFGTAWCAQYGSREAARIDEFGLRVIPHVDWPPPADTITVPLSACCGALPGDVCDCWRDAADLADAPLLLLGRDYR